MSTKIVWGICIDTEEDQSLRIKPLGEDEDGRPMMSIKTDGDHALKIPVQELEQALQQIKQESTNVELGSAKNEVGQTKVNTDTSSE